MTTRRIVLLLFPLLLAGSFHSQTFAQGGWRQWRVHLLNGTEVEANPLGMNKAGKFTVGMGIDKGIDRSKITYLAISGRELPPIPDGVTKQDMVVMLDGSQTLGRVTIRDLKFSEGVILQNGREITTEYVAYIIFAHTKKKKPDPKH